MAKRVVTAMLLVLGAALTANCSDDSSGTVGGMGGEGAVNGAGEGSGATSSSGGTNTGATGGTSDAGSPPSMAGAGDLGGGGPSPGGAPQGGAAQGGAGGAGPEFMCPETIEDYPTLVTQAICGKRVECCANDDAETCTTEVTAAMADVFPGLAQAKADGIVAEDCAALEACVAAIAAADCSEWPKELPEIYGLPVDEPACRGIIKGLVAPQDECVASYQCDNGVCSNDACVALVADGQSCEQGTCNLATSYCNAEDECAPREPNGTACTANGDCASRICDTQDTGLCIAPDPVTQCEFVPEAGCSVSGRPVQGSAGWSLLVAALVLGAGSRRRSRHEARHS